MRHYNFQRSTVGFIEWAAIAGDAVKFISSLFGGDKVPNYPIKSQNTLNTLVAEVQRNVTLPPSSVADAKVQLARAQAALQREMSGSGVANQSIRMMYQEVIDALNAYIRSAGSTNVPLPGTGTGTGSGTGTGGGYVPPLPSTTGNFLTDTSLFGLPNWVTLGGAAVGVYFLTRKKRRR